MSRAEIKASEHGKLTEELSSTNKTIRQLSSENVTLNATSSNVETLKDTLSDMKVQRDKYQAATKLEQEKGKLDDVQKQLNELRLEAGKRRALMYSNSY